MEVSLQIHWWGNSPRNHQVRGWEDSSTDTVAKRNISVSTGHSNLVIQSAACDYNDWTILAPQIYSMLSSSVAVQVYGLPLQTHFDTWAMSMLQNCSCTGNVTTIQHNLGCMGQINLPGIEHTFLTPTAHRLANKVIKILISHVTNFSYWLIVGRYYGIYG